MCVPAGQLNHLVCYRCGRIASVVSLFLYCFLSHFCISVCLLLLFLHRNLSRLCLVLAVFVLLSEKQMSACPGEAS